MMIYDADGVRVSVVPCVVESTSVWNRSCYGATFFVVSLFTFVCVFVHTGDLSRDLRQCI